MSEVAIVGCDSYDPERVLASLTEAIEQVGGLTFIEKGMIVGIKANLVSYAKPEAAVTTHPAVVEALCKMITDRGATAVIGDSPGGLFNAAYVGRIMKAAGFHDLVREGVKLNDDYSEREAQFKEGKEARTFLYTGWLDSCDVIINVCKLKTHGMMGMSCAAKNMFGVIPGVAKPEYHYRFPSYERFSDMIIDLNEYFKPALCVCDAVVGMEGNGPTAGTPREIGCILASKSPYRLDLAAADVIGLTKEQVPTLEAAFRRDLIPEKAEDLDIYGDLKKYRISDYQNIASLHGLGFKGFSNSVIFTVFGGIAPKLLTSKPTLKKSLCVGCNLCGKICPAKAITIVKGKATIDRSACIRCFCCQEFCPKGAMRVHRPLVAKMFARKRG